MAKIGDYLYVRKNNSYEANISVPKDRAQDFADALEFLKSQNLSRSKSALICAAVIESAKNRGFTSENNGKVSENDENRLASLLSTRVKYPSVAEMIERGEL